jgi:hypothetical protein
MVEIARQEGAEYRSVRLNIGSDGTMRMDTHDIRPSTSSTDGRETCRHRSVRPAHPIAEAAVGSIS